MALDLLAPLRSRLSDALLISALATCCAGSRCAPTAPDAQLPDAAGGATAGDPGSCCGPAGSGQTASGGAGSAGTTGTAGTSGAAGTSGSDSGSPCTPRTGSSCADGGVVADGGVLPDGGALPDSGVLPDSGAPPSTATVIASNRISQDWGAAAWSPASMTFANVQAGDSIIVLGMYWDASHGPSAAPTISGGTLVAAVNQAPAFYNASPPVYTQLFYMLNASAGTHVVTAPNVGGGEGDGTLYAIQVRGISSIVMTGSNHAVGSAVPNVSVALAGNAQPGDFVVAIGGYDNTAQFPSAQISNPPAGWSIGGVQNDASNNVPSQVSYRIAPAVGTQAVSWTWADPNVNVTASSIAAFR